MTDEELKFIWRRFHELSRLNRYTREELDKLGAVLKQVEKESPT